MACKSSRTENAEDTERIFKAIETQLFLFEGEARTTLYVC